ncbi:MAG: AraC family transcriptional regulator [Monoglobales bacterium]
MSIKEQTYKINGIDSWIHCVKIIQEEPSVDITPCYHYHKYIEFLYSIKSDAVAWINGNCNTFTTGDLIIINSDSPHDIRFNGYSEYICVKFWPEILYSDEQALFEFKYLMPFLIDESRIKIFHHDELTDSKIPELALEIMSEWEKKTSAYELIIRSNILRIFAWVFRYWNSQLNFQDKPIPEKIKKAINFIGDNFLTVTEQEVADHCGITYNHFSYLFKDSIGKTFSEYILALKLREAEKLLISTDKSITDIAFETGFSTTSHFISRFKEIKGITPAKFRKNLL